MVLLEKIWDEIVNRSDTNCRLAGLSKTINTPPLVITDARGATTTAAKCKRTRSVPGCSAAIIKSPTEPVVCKDCSVWGSVLFPDAEKEINQYSASSSTAFQLHPGGAFFNPTQPYIPAGMHFDIYFMLLVLDYFYSKY